jgi:hypothetical protein
LWVCKFGAIFLRNYKKHIRRNGEENGEKERIHEGIYRINITPDSFIQGLNIMCILS